MNPESDNLTASESLDLIASMIQQAKGKVQRNNFFFLFWGWVLVAANLGMYALSKLHYEHPYAVWLMTIPAWLFTFYKISTRKKAERSTSHFDRISVWLWMSFGITIFFVVLFGFKINFQLNPVILTISAMPTVDATTIPTSSSSMSTGRWRPALP